MQKDKLIKSFIIHSKKLNNSNLIIYLLTEDFGLIKVFYNYSNYNNNKYKKSKSSLIQPFKTILIKLNNKKNQITHIEEYLEKNANNYDNINLKNINNNHYYHKAYLNELIYLLYKNYNNDPNSTLFNHYNKTLYEININENINDIKLIIHNFETNILKDLGYEINFTNITKSQNNDLYYQYNIENNIFNIINLDKFTLGKLNITKITLRTLINNLIFPHSILEKLKKQEYCSSCALRYAIKILNFNIIKYYLNNQKINSYEFID